MGELSFLDALGLSLCVEKHTLHYSKRKYYHEICYSKIIYKCVVQKAHI